ncbi:hypothetical protein F4Y59_00515 [Candidatus Poribacteria bacterium]|nr:hypothetical protein [Candidatus Poribacteria bacterium]MYK18909.1 hypothetical protein [Candidatus Poribacteria bacterium]
MRVLLDENLDWRLVRYFDADFQVTTVSRQGWKGMRNGELLEQAAAAFDALVTMDKGIEHQQNFRKYAIGVILISARSNRLQDIQPAMLQVNAVFRKIQPRNIIHVTVS